MRSSLLRTLVRRMSVVVSRHGDADAVLIERPLRAPSAAAATADGNHGASAAEPQGSAEDDDGVRILRLNTAQTLNCLSDSMAHGFASALAELRATPGLRAVVVTGAGRGFCAGGSYDFISERLACADPARNAGALERLYGTFLALRSLPVPVIAAVNGPAVGGGAGVALACDMRLIASGASIGLNFVRLGISPGMGATFLLPRATSHAVACRLLLTGEVVGAEEAVALGLALGPAHPPAELLPAAVGLARRMAAGCPRAVRDTLRVLRNEGGGGQEALLRAARQEAARQGFFFTRPDAKEGLEAVRGKRAARFQPPEEGED